MFGTSGKPIIVTEYSVKISDIYIYIYIWHGTAIVYRVHGKKMALLFPFDRPTNCALIYSYFFTEWSVQYVFFIHYFFTGTVFVTSTKNSSGF